MSVKDIHAVLVDSALANADLHDKVTESVTLTDAKALVAQASTGQELVDLVLRAALVASAEHLPMQIKAVQMQVHAESEALKKSDVTKVPAITNVHISEARAQRQKEKTDG